MLITDLPNSFVGVSNVYSETAPPCGHRGFKFIRNRIPMELHEATPLSKYSKCLLVFVIKGAETVNSTCCIRAPVDNMCLCTWSDTFAQV